ncbi:unnamed protein product [Nippostrongylus brasiliensis]|uniref:Uncharacterized protein n=1 Tax=Nippostrongylus brasiliensis TaxID=27835 RepID=A0A0N4XIN7_NIPBR|nr:unnamed protein product [Nippostrongylus brasiliensis]
MVKKVQKQTAGHQTLDRQKMEKEIREFLENQFKREAGARYGALLSKADEIYEKLREDIRKASEFVLPKEIHALNLLDFLNGVGCSDEHDEGCKAETPSSENLIVESNEDLLSPNTREVVSLFKSLVRKKVAEAQKREPDLSQECD